MDFDIRENRAKFWERCYWYTMLLTIIQSLLVLIVPIERTTYTAAAIGTIALGTILFAIMTLIVPSTDKVDYTNKEK